MKIQIVSDTHNDLRRFTPNKDAELIIHAGDFNSGHIASMKPIENFVNLCTYYNKECVFVLGNHDYYGHNFYDSPIEKECYERGYNLLTINNTFNYKGFEFIGSIFCTDFELPEPGYNNVELTKMYCRRTINDFHSIFKDSAQDNLITPNDYVEEFKKSLEFIEPFRYKENIVLVTHFPISSSCLDPRYGNSPLNPYFINDVNLEGFSTVISGHTHTTLHNKVNNTDVYINAYGYSEFTKYECDLYDPNFIIEL